MRHHKQSNLENAINYQTKCLEICDMQGDGDGKEDAHFGLGISSLCNGMDQKADSCFDILRKLAAPVHPEAQVRNFP